MKKKLFLLFYCIPFFVIGQVAKPAPTIITQWWLTELVTIVSEYFVAEESQPPPTVDFTFTNNNMCEGTTIAFTSIVTDGVGDIDYDWNFGDGSNSTQTNPTHVFNPPNGCGTTTYSVTLTVTDENNDTDTISYNITVLEKPNVDVTDIDNQFDPFSNCASASPNFLINVGNTSDSCISTFSVDWGDGNTESNISFPISHNYTQIGVYQMTFTGVGNNGCIGTKSYPVKNVSNPAGAVVSPGNTNNLCAPTEELGFSITSWGENSDDTTYQVNYGDGTIVSYSQTTLKASTYYDSANPSNSANFPIPHIYPNSSCPGGGFDITLTITNACDTTTSQLLNITVLSDADPDFIWTGNECINNSILFQSTGDLGFGPNCNQNAIYDWDFGDGNIITNGASSVTHVYTAPGTYDVTLNVEMFCGETTITKQICIEEPPVPVFSLNTNEGCFPLSSSATNTTSTANMCNSLTYLWEINYTAANCGTLEDWSFIGGTDQTSVNPQFQFNAAGIYNITLTATNDCGGVTSAAQSVSVKSPPTATIVDIPNYCGATSISPVATIEICTNNAAEVSYLWSFPGGTPATSSLAVPGVINYTTPGDYTVTLEVTNNCGNSVATEDFSIFDQPVIDVQPLISQTLCQNSTPTNLEVSASVGAGSLSYQWYSNTTNTNIGGTLISGATNNTYTPPTSTIGILYYYVVVSQVTAPDCNVVSNTSEVEVLTAPTFTQQPVGSSVCENGAANQLMVDYSNGTGTPTYQWYSNTVNSNTGGVLITGATSNTYNPPTTPVGMTYYYCIISFTGGGCSEIISDTALVDVTAAVVIDSQPIATQNTCIEGTVSTILEITYSGGAGAVTYQWYSNTVNNNTGGTPIVGATSSSYTPPASATSGSFYYYVIVTLDGVGCTGATSDVSEIIVVEDPVVDTQPIVNQSLCQGVSPVDLAVVAFGGIGSFEYQWYSNTTNTNTGGTLITGVTSSTYTPLTTTVGTLYYYVEISQAPTGIDCFVVSNTSEVEVLTAPTFTQQPVGSSVCENGAANQLMVDYSNGTGTPTYQWYSNTVNSNTGGVLITGATSNTYNPPTTPVGMTYYYCIISFTGSGCSEIISDTALVDVTAAVVIDSQPIATQNTCIEGTVSTILEITFSGGSGAVTYQWYSNTVNNNTGGTPIVGATSSSYTPPASTTSGSFYYYVIVTLDGVGCTGATSEVSEVVVVNDPVVDSQPIVNQSLCQGAIPVDLAVVASGGIGSFEYQWYSNTTNTNTGGTLIIGATNAIYSPPTTTVGTLYYYVLITQLPSNLDCSVVSNTSEVEVTQAPSIITQPISSDICINEVANDLEVVYANGTGTPVYQWYSNTVDMNSGGNLIVGANSSIYTPPTNTVGILYYYYCEITFSSGGCSLIVSDTAEIKVNQTPVIADYSDEVCSSLLFEFDPSTIVGNSAPSGTTYTWTLPNISPGGSIIGATVSGTPQTIFSQTLTNITIAPATVIYTVTPASGICIGIPFDIEILVNPGISVTTSITDSQCFNDNNGSINTTITGGTPISPSNPYTISWTGPSGFASSNANISNLAPGIYTLNVLDDSSCTFNMDYVVNEPDELILTTDAINDISCFGNNDGEILISVSGGIFPYTYLWTTIDGAGLIPADEDQTNLAPGNYDVLITDANDCTLISSYEIIEPIELLISETHNSLICYGDNNGEIIVNINQQTFSNYTYSISGTDYLGNPYNSTINLSDLTHTFNGLLAGIYTVTVTDANSCFKAINTIEITQPSGITINYTKVDETCYGSRDGSITLNVTGGTPSYTYDWSDFGSGPIRTNLSAGIYTVIVTDQSNCTQTESIEILSPDFHIEPEVENISCFGENDGHIKLNIFGGVTPITVTWNDDASAGEERNNLSPGTYTVLVTDSDSPSCPINQSFTITEPAQLNVSGNITNALDCDIVNSGAINLLVSGGTLPFTFSWSNGATSEDLIDIPPGDYTVVVTDANSCEEARTFNVFRPGELELNIDTLINSNCVTREVEQRNELIITGGIPPFNIQWSRGTVDPLTPTVMTTDVEGAVLVDVTDSMGCTRQLAFDAVLDKIGVPSFEMTSFGFEEYGNYSIDDPIFFTNTSTETPIEVSWNFGDQSENSNEFSPQHTYNNIGSYAVTLTVTFAYGCEYTVTKQIEITQGYDLIMPTAFTPNQDGINDTMRPSFFGLKEVEMSVFNTWGQKVYYENSLSLEGWDGLINGKDAENGNYVLSVRVVTFYGKEIKLNTPITLLR